MYIQGHSQAYLMGSEEIHQTKILRGDLNGRSYTVIDSSYALRQALKAGEDDDCDTSGALCGTLAILIFVGLIAMLVVGIILNIELLITISSITLMGMLGFACRAHGLQCCH